MRPSGASFKRKARTTSIRLATTMGNAPLTFDRPVKAVFSADGSTAYVLNCGPECGGTTAGRDFTPLPVASSSSTSASYSGTLPAQPPPLPHEARPPTTAVTRTLPIAGGASNAILDSATMYVVGQQPQTIGGQVFYGGNLTVLNLVSGPTNGWATASSPVSISDGQPGAPSAV